MRLAVVLLVAVARALSVLPASPRALAAGGARCHRPRISSSSSIVARADDSHMAPEYREAGKGSQIISLLEKAGSPLLSWLERKLDSWRKRYRPKRIILVRHGQSVGNIDSTLYGTIPDSQISLTERGFAQGAACGLQIRRLVGNETTRFYYSPYLRARQTLLAILDAFQNTGEVALVAEPRLREQDFGNFQDPEGMATVFRERQKFGRFYYRFPNGEAGTDVYDRMSDFQAVRADLQPTPPTPRTTRSSNPSCWLLQLLHCSCFCIAARASARPLGRTAAGGASLVAMPTLPTLPAGPVAAPKSLRHTFLLTRLAHQQPSSPRDFFALWMVSPLPADALFPNGRPGSEISLHRLPPVPRRRLFERGRRRPSGREEHAGCGGELRPRHSRAPDARLLHGLLEMDGQGV